MPVRREPNAWLPVVASLAVTLGGCQREDDNAARARAEEALMLRQIQGLQDLVKAAETSTLTNADQIAVAIDDKLVAEMIAVGLPLERDVGDRYRVRLENVEVEFRSARSQVVLRGRVSALGAPATFADLRLAGGLDQVVIDAKSGLFRAKIVLDELQVERSAASGAQAQSLDDFVEDVARERVDSFAELVPEIQIPIKLDQAIKLKGFSEGPIAVGGGTLPIKLGVARLMPLSGRLWILLTAQAGPWVRDGTP